MPTEPSDEITVTEQDVMAAMERRIMELEAEAKRLSPWVDLLKAAPPSVRESIQERYLGAEVLGPIVQAWKDKVADLEDEVIRLRDEGAACDRAIDQQWLDLVRKCEAIVHAAPLAPADIPYELERMLRDKLKFEAELIVAKQRIAELEAEAQVQHKIISAYRVVRNYQK
jgi:hypothetical protein